MRFANDRDLVIDVLVKRAGSGLFGDHVDLDDERVASMIALNATALTELPPVHLEINELHPLEVEAKPLTRE